MSEGTLRRPILPMPDFIREALASAGLLEAYAERPPYQRNDYIGWITRAKRPETVEKRLAQMLRELRGGKAYMNMIYRPSRRASATGETRGRQI